MSKEFDKMKDKEGGDGQDNEENEKKSRRLRRSTILL